MNNRPDAYVEAVKIAAALGGQWKAVKPASDFACDSEWRAYLVEGDAPDALRLFVNSSWQKNGRIGISMTYVTSKVGGRQINANDALPYDQRNSAPDVTVDPKRPADVLARDINRRVILLARPIWQLMLDHRDQMAKDVADSNDVEARLAAAWGAKLNPHTDRSGTSRSLYAYSLPGSVSADIRVNSSSSVEVKLSGLSPELAERLGRIVLEAVGKKSG